MPSDNSSVPINVDQRHDRTPRNCEQMPKNKFKWNKLKGLLNKYSSDREIISKYPENTEIWQRFEKRERKLKLEFYEF